MTTSIQKKRWSERPRWQQVGLVLLGVLQLGLLAAALVDIRRRPAEQINGNKWLWTGVSFINFVGPIAYFLFGRKR